MKGRRLKWKVLAVLSGAPSSDQQKPEGPFLPGVLAGATLTPAHFLPFFPGLHELHGGEVEVQIIDRPNLQYLQTILQAAQPNLVFFSQSHPVSGTDSTPPGQAEEMGPLKLGAAESPTPEDLAQAFSVHAPDLVLANVLLTPKHAESIRSKGVQHVIYWPAPAPPLAASHFFTALFSCLRNPSVNPHDAFRIAEASHRIHCYPEPQTPNPDSGALNPPHLLTQALNPPHLPTQALNPCPAISGIPPPGSITCSLEMHQRIPPNGSLVVWILSKPQQELRLLVFGGPRVLEPQRVLALGEGLRVLLASEVRGLRFMQHAAAAAPMQEIATLGAQHGLVFMRCDLCTVNDVRLSVVSMGLPQAFEDREILEYHLKRILLDRLTLQVLPKPSNTLPARRNSTIADGGSTCEVTLALPDWEKSLLIQLAADVSYRPLAALGFAGVGSSAVTSFSAGDGERLLGLEGRSTEPSERGGVESMKGGSADGLDGTPPLEKPEAFDLNADASEDAAGLEEGVNGGSEAIKERFEARVDGGFEGVSGGFAKLADKRGREEEVSANLRAWKRAAKTNLNDDIPVARPVPRRFWRQDPSLAPETPEQAAPANGHVNALGGVNSVSPPDDKQPMEKETTGVSLLPPSPPVNAGAFITREPPVVSADGTLQKRMQNGTPLGDSTG